MPDTQGDRIREAQNRADEWTDEWGERGYGIHPTTDSMVADVRELLTIAKRHTCRHCGEAMADHWPYCGQTAYGKTTFEPMTD